MLAIALGVEGFRWGFSPIPLFAFLGALLFLGILYFFARTPGKASDIYLAPCRGYLELLFQRRDDVLYLSDRLKPVA